MSILEIIFVCFAFAIAAFFRTGLGFGGAVFGLPLLLLVKDDALYWLPMIGVHLLFFTTISLAKPKNINWQYLSRALIWILPGKIAGVLGLIQLPADLISMMINVITNFYSISYIINYEITGAKNSWLECVFLIVG